MTMRELAKLANVSASTVSKAFHGAKDISPETREHIFSVAKEYGCYGTFCQEKFHKKVIAIICPELAGSYYCTFTELLQDMIEKAGCIAMISTDHFRADKQAELIEYYSEYLKVDGILIFDLQHQPKRGQNVPIVSLYSNKFTSVDCIGIDIKSAIYDAIRLLQEHGHSKIAFLGEQLTSLKEGYYREAAADLLPEPPVIITSKHRFEQAGEDCIAQLKQHRDITALICAYDDIAFGAIKALQAMGLCIPHDISVIGIDNSPMGNYTSTSLTTIDTKPEEVCTLAWKLLQKKMASPFYKSTQNISIRSGLIARESVGPAKSKASTLRK